ncbi:alpha carbonic anhydrase 1, chloroplastic [Ziziphus jujuba]|uniref:Alpha carbonic anhydrase 1, chloroplastic n=1 Tax=Ziziphus jujuba TaxID=326968 RepID=A0A6P4B8M5_ZIZJJ|nr:alpha carbonic anhydrase 1, chloroplastic [Ziziphus jujuba]XP_048321489.2 alpha carbonic anhydrase 1, chloroplastic [Ziziphus jujuba]
MFFLLPCFYVCQGNRQLSSTLITTMIPRISFSILLLALLVIGASSTSTDANAPEFSYEGGNGPEKWGTLTSSYTQCSNGKMQSPVNIVNNQVTRGKTFKSLTRIYNPCNSTLINNGFNVGIHFEEYAGVMVVDGKNYTLKQLHYHSPSEHQLQGVQYPVEQHLVHRADDGSSSVVAILYQYDKPDPFLAKFMDKLTELAKENCQSHEQAHIAVGTLDLKLLKKQTRKFYRYIGSLTTPPCTEQVIWNILARVRSISKEQVEALKAPVRSNCKNNARPLQPLNGRQVELYAEIDHDD